MAAVTDIMASGVRPSMVEFVDGVTVRAIQAYRDMGLPDGAGAMLIVRSDRGPRAPEDLERMGAISRAAGALEVALADTPAEGELLMEARRLVVPAIERLGAVMFEDVAVPRARLVELLAGVDAIAERNGVVIACCGHAGDGNMHPAIVTERGDRAAAPRARAAFDEIMTLALTLGGTITGEHGVGLLKRQALGQELGVLNQDLQRRIRSVFDPQGILNPGKIFA
jgi:glycolate oxidase